MRRALVTASALLSLGFASPAFSQAPPTDRGPGQTGATASQRDHDEGDEHEMMGGRMLGRMMRGRQMEGMMAHLAHELAQGVFYRVKRGDDEVILHCPQNMALNACVSGATELLKGMGEATEQSR
jgi:hypothetical protein